MKGTYPNRYSLLLPAIFALPAIGLLILIQNFNQLAHWFIVPTFILFVLLAWRTVPWILCRVDVFDVKSHLFLVAIYFFSIAPILHVVSDYWLPSIQPPDDWRPWLGGMAVLNIFGIISFLMGVRLLSLKRLPVVSKYWEINPVRFWPLLVGFCLVSLIIQVLIYSKYGGVSGYMLAALDRSEFDGMGLLFSFSEAFPVLLLMGLAYACYTKKIQLGLGSLIFILLVFLLLKLYFGGLRGSRSNTIWGLYWAVGIVHLYMRRVPRLLIGIGLGFLILFMIGYSYIKTYGPDGTAAITDSSMRSSDTRYGGAPLLGVFLVDFSRSDVQSFLLYRQLGMAGSTGYALGETYFNALTKFMPRSDKPDLLDKRTVGTDFLYGNRVLGHGDGQATRLYGVGGEALLNFGFLGIVPVYFVFGLGVGWLTRIFVGLNSGDARLFFLPLLGNLIILTLIADLDNLLFYAVKNGLPIVVLILLSVRVRSSGR